MNSLDGLKTCRKGLHQYSANFKQCPECRKIRYENNKDKCKKQSREWYVKNKERRLEKSREWDEKNKDRKKENSSKWYKRNRERWLEYSKNRREQNKERYKELQKNWYQKNKNELRHTRKEWAKRNKGKINAIAAKRRAMKKLATPPWADKLMIEKIYLKAAHLQEISGIAHHVDHIYPLVNPYICGLHIAENLQILTAEENLKKSNNYWPGQLECQRLPLHMNGFQEITDRPAP